MYMVDILFSIRNQKTMSNNFVICCLNNSNKFNEKLKVMQDTVKEIFIFSYTYCNFTNSVKNIFCIFLLYL